MRRTRTPRTSSGSSSADARVPPPVSSLHVWYVRVYSSPLPSMPLRPRAGCPFNSAFHPLPSIYWMRPRSRRRHAPRDTPPRTCGTAPPSPRTAPARTITVAGYLVFLVPVEGPSGRPPRGRAALSIQLARRSPATRRNSRTARPFAACWRSARHGASSSHWPVLIAPLRRIPSTALSRPGTQTIAGRPSSSAALSPAASGSLQRLHFRCCRPVPPPPPSV